MDRPAGWPQDDRGRLVSHAGALWRAGRALATAAAKVDGLLGLFGGGSEVFGWIEPVRHGRWTTDGSRFGGVGLILNPVLGCFQVLGQLENAFPWEVLAMC